MDNLGTRKTPQSASSRTLVRVASRSDARAIASLLLAAFTEFRELYTPEAFASTVQPESGILARMEEGPVWVAEKGSAIVGTASAIPAVEHLMVRGMAVSPEARGSGIAKVFLQQAEDFARQQGYRRLALYTTAFLRSATHLYESAGFQFTGETICPHRTELLRMEKVLRMTQEYKEPA